MSPTQTKLRGGAATTLAILGALLAGHGLVASAALPLAVANDQLELRTLEGPAWSTAELERGTTVLVFWAGWSPKCRDIVAQASAIRERAGGRARVIMVNFQESPDQARSFLGAGASSPQVLDEQGSLAKRYSMVALPGLLVTREGQTLYQGRLPADAPAFVESLLQP
jgi:thiol-disulfide isomerase/thioredoxin